MPRIREIVKISMLSVKSKLNENDRKFCFELFGYDFFIDADFKVWLIEINTNPCIEESSPLLSMLIPRMIDDALKLTVDLLFAPAYTTTSCKLSSTPATSSSSIVETN
jgi:Tubulin-tyrosine ligase family